MAIDFPNNPLTDDIFTDGDNTVTPIGLLCVDCASIHVSEHLSVPIDYVPSVLTEVSTTS
jgi:hypothetical protein